MLLLLLLLLVLLQLLMDLLLLVLLQLLVDLLLLLQLQRLLLLMSLLLLLLNLLLLLLLEMLLVLVNLLRLGRLGSRRLLLLRLLGLADQVLQHLHGHAWVLGHDVVQLDRRDLPRLDQVQQGLHRVRRQLLEHQLLDDALARDLGARLAARRLGQGLGLGLGLGLPLDGGLADERAGQRRGGRLRPRGVHRPMNPDHAVPPCRSLLRGQDGDVVDVRTRVNRLAGRGRPSQDVGLGALGRTEGRGQGRGRGRAGRRRRAAGGPREGLASHQRGPDGLPVLLHEVLLAEGEEDGEVAVGAEVCRAQHATQALHLVQRGDVHLPALRAPGLPLHARPLVGRAVAAALGVELGGHARLALALVGLAHALQGRLRGLHGEGGEGAAEGDLGRHVGDDEGQLLADLPPGIID